MRFGARPRLSERPYLERERFELATLCLEGRSGTWGAGVAMAEHRGVVLVFRPLPWVVQNVFPRRFNSQSSLRPASPQRGSSGSN